MPELPEAEVIRQDLSKFIIGKKIKRVNINNPKPIKQPSVVQFKKLMTGATFKDIIRKAKALIFKLSNGKYLVVHLRLNGQLVYDAESPKSRVNFLLANGKYLNYNDSRLLGELKLVDNYENIPFFKNLGIEPLDKKFTADKFFEMLQKKKTKIKPLLMDQAFIAGIGNIYAQEALFLAGISPWHPANKIKKSEAQKLHTAIIQVLKEGIKYRGSSVDAYVNGTGKQGTYHLRLKVYDREGESCVKCKAVIKKIQLGGRGTSFCPKCQK